jgi:hypothetical protein
VSTTPTQKDAPQVLRYSFDDDTNSLRVTTLSSPLPAGAATSANQTNGTQKSQLVDGTGVVNGPFQVLSGTNYAPVVLAASVTPGAATVARSVQIAGTDGTNARTIAVDTVGKVKIVTHTPITGTITQAAVTVGTTAIRATVSGGAPDANRQVLIINPSSASPAKFYLGSSGVTNSGAGRGIELLAGDQVYFNNDAGDYYIISDTAAQTVYLLEQV